MAYNRRDFMKAVLAMGAGALAGCRADHPDITLDNPDALAASNRFNNSAIGTSGEQYINDVVNTFLCGPKTVALPSISKKTRSELTSSEREALDKHYSALAQYAGAAAQAGHLSLANTVLVLYNKKDEVAQWANFSDEQKEQANENFRLALDRKNGALMDQGEQSYNALLALLAPQSREQYGAAMTSLRAKIGTGSFSPKAQKELEAYFKAGDQNIKSYEHSLTAVMALSVGEGLWGQSIRDTVALIDALEQARGSFKPTDIAAGYDNAQIDDEHTIGSARAEELQKVERHYRVNDDNRDDDIFNDNRFRIASAYANLATQGSLIEQGHVGGIFTLDDMISIASKTPENKLVTFLDYVVEALPTGYDIGKIALDLEYGFTRNSPIGNTQEIFGKVMKAYAGFSGTDWRVGDESVEARILVRLLLAAVKYGSLAYSLASGGHGGRSSNGSPRDSGVQGKINGSETGGAGIK